MDEIISIIVPVYNASKYIEECICSILEQTYKNIEILLVDDGSKDNSLKICNRFASEDKRVKVFSKANTGVSDTRNYGIENCSGKYVTFVDSDDRLESTAIEKMYNKLKETEADVVIGGVCDFYDDGKTIPHKYNLQKIIEYNNEEALKALLLEYPFNGVVWSKLYKRELFNTQKFDINTKIAEDLKLLYKMFFHCKKIIFFPDIVYHWRINPNSVTKQALNESWFKEVSICEEIIQFVSSECPEIIKYAQRRYLSIILTLSRKAIKENGSKEQRKLLKECLFKYKFLNNNLLNMKEMLKLLYFRCFL